MTSRNEKTEEYYSLLFKHHIQYILRSGLLLEEDMDNLLSYYNADNEDVSEQRITLLQKVFGACSFGSLMLSLYKKQSPLLSVAAASPLMIISVKRLLDTLRRKKQMHNLESFVDTVGKLSKLNRAIAEYFRVRRIADPATIKIVNPYTRRMKQMVETIFNEEVNLLYTFRIFIRDFGSYVPSIKTYYAYLENLEFTDFSPSNVRDVNDGVIYLQKLCDIYVLLSSNCLTCLALVLCRSVWIENCVNFDVIFNRTIPRMKAVTSDCYNAINRKFDDVKYHYLNQRQIRKNFKKPKPNAASKLQLYAYSTMSCTTEIVEKSKMIYKKVQEVDLHNLSEKEKLAKCISELRAQVFDYYDCLDTLYKIFQVNINACQGKSPSSHLEIPKEANDTDLERIVVDASLNPVEPAGDEEYESYVGGENETSTESASYFEEETRKLAAQLSQELKRKLKAHAQFIAARKKRGVIDEEPEEPENVPEDESDDAPPMIQFADPAIPPERPFGNQRFLIPPPPPPPLPPIDLGPYGGNGNYNDIYTVDDFLEAIQAASKSRTSVEEVFFSGSDEELGEN